LPWLNQGGAGGGMGGIFGDLVGGLGSFFGGFFAEGGNFMGGKPIVVGENGAEMIMPRSGGTVIPNHAMGGKTIVNMNITTPDVNSFKRSQSQIAAAMAESVRRGTRNL
jgi:phage-related minor tail protein